MPTSGSNEEENDSEENNKNEDMSIFMMTFQKLESLATFSGRSQNTEDSSDDESHQLELVNRGIKEFENSWTIKVDDDVTSEVQTQHPHN